MGRAALKRDSEVGELSHSTECAAALDASRPRAPAWHNPLVPPSLRILGIDPGLNRTGYGVIEVSGTRLGPVAAGVIRVPAGDLHERLGTILRALGDVIRDTRPHVATIEKVFVNVNPQSTLLLGQARGAAICAAVGEGLVVHEYAALRIKQAVVGFGQADKKQVQLMVQRLLALDSVPATDAADALACAICHAHSRTLLAAVTRTGISAAPRRGSASAARRAWAARAAGGR
jgi:crossover junction endodeoxyribonuclease RuvC